MTLARAAAAIAALTADLTANAQARSQSPPAVRAVDRAALSPLPAEPFVYAEWRIRRVLLDYYVDVDGHYYSVPHRLLREQVEARVTARTIELFHKGERGGRS